MKKLKLQMEDLRVDSFDTTSAEKGKGTVFGEQCTCYTQCTCPGCPSCGATCPYTCDDDTCAGSCPAPGNTCANTCAYYYTCQQVTECGASGYPNNCPW
jgi:hypothetical protein